MPRTISPEQLIPLIGTADCPIVVDVRREPVFRSSATRIAGAIWRDHMAVRDWAQRIGLRTGRSSSIAFTATMSARWRRRCLRQKGSMSACSRAASKPSPPPAGFWSRARHRASMPRRPSIWVTRERPKIDRIACPWLIRRFIDPHAVFHFVQADWVKDVAEELGAIPFDIEGVHYSHRGETCTFDTLIAEFAITDPALSHLARIVRGADTARLDLEPQSAGLLALSLGLSAIETGRSAPARSRDADLRRAVRLVPSRNRGAPQLAGEGGRGMNAAVSRARRRLARRGDPRLRQDRAVVVRRAGRPDRADAPCPRRRKALARRGAVPACAELLHAVARARGDAACDLCGLAAAWRARRTDRRAAVRAARARSSSPRCRRSIWRSAMCLWCKACCSGSRLPCSPSCSRR